MRVEMKRIQSGNVPEISIHVGLIGKKQLPSEFEFQILDQETEKEIVLDEDIKKKKQRIKESVPDR